MQQIIARLISAGVTLIVAFGVVLGFGEVLEAVGDQSAAAVCGYVALGLAMAWVVVQILLVGTLGMWVLRQKPSGLAQPPFPAAEAQLDQTDEAEEESGLPPRG
jgi:hypothetical protein